MSNYENVEYKKSNREKAMTPSKKGYGWCWGCDICLVGKGQKCPVCKTVAGHRTIKKETNA